MADVVVIGGPERLSRLLLAELAVRGERAVHMPEGGDLRALAAAHAAINLAGHAEQASRLVAALSNLPASSRPLVLIDASGETASQVRALQARQLGLRVVLLRAASPQADRDEAVDLILHALRAWDLTGHVDAVAAQRSGYRSRRNFDRGLVGAGS